MQSLDRLEQEQIRRIREWRSWWRPESEDGIEQKGITDWEKRKRRGRGWVEFDSENKSWLN
jgi:hypothetical protein